jgi:hypothetical protein
MSTRSLAAGIVIGASIATAVGIAYAAIPDSGGVVHACYQNVTSANKPVKLLDTAKATACPSGWKPVTWNQKGAQGPPGPSGTSIVLRGRASGIDVAPGSGDDGVHPAVDVGLSPNSWVQAGDQLDLLAGTITVTAPSSCHRNGNAAAPEFILRVRVNGVDVPGYTDIQMTFSDTVTSPIAFTATAYQRLGVPGAAYTIFEPGTATTDTVQILAQNRCWNAGEDFTIQNVGLDVVGVQ